jgi:hypothetical protein
MRASRPYWAAFVAGHDAPLIGERVAADAVISAAV